MVRASTTRIKIVYRALEFLTGRRWVRCTFVPTGTGAGGYQAFSPVFGICRVAARVSKLVQGRSRMETTHAPSKRL